MTRRELLFSIPACAAPVLAQSETGTSLDFGQWVVADGPESAFYADATGEIVATSMSHWPAWLRTRREYENFDLTLDFFLKGWMDGGVYLHAPEHGRPGHCGIKVNIFHARDEKPQSNSMGSVFPLLAPSAANAHKPEWNSMRILMDWPALRVWVNGTQVQDANLEKHAELRRRLRSGFLGLTAIGYPMRFRNIRVRGLPAKDKWQTLYRSPADFDNWFVSEGKEKVKFVPAGEAIWCDGSGHLATKEKYRDFELQMYVRGPKAHNGGIIFRSDATGTRGKRYEIQLHNVEEAHYPTGSLYHYKRAAYPRMEDEKWFPVQLGVQGKECWVRINGDTVLEHDALENLDEGHIELQAHAPGHWMEFKNIRVKRL
jgi:hypothetical protein